MVLLGMFLILMLALLPWMLVVVVVVVAVAADLVLATVDATPRVVRAVAFLVNEVTKALEEVIDNIISWNYGSTNTTNY
jgi:hypothetical protein